MSLGHEPTEDIKSKHIGSKCIDESRQKVCVTLSITCDIEILSDRRCYVCSHFVEVLTENDSDVASVNSKVVGDL